MEKFAVGDETDSAIYIYSTFLELRNENVM